VIGTSGVVVQTAAGRVGDTLVGVVFGPTSVEVTVVRTGPVTFVRAPFTVSLGGRALAPTGACRPFCRSFRLGAPAARGGRLVVRPVHASAAASFAVPRRRPAAATGAAQRAARRMRAFKSLRMVETLETGRSRLVGRFRYRSPDRMAYRSSDGAEAVVIGGRRWDRVGGGRWLESETARRRVPPLEWANARHARVVGVGRVGRTPVMLVSLFRADPSYPVWFQLALARDGRVLQTRMLAPAHFMVDRYSGFGAPVAIDPPR
jgi:hypothetical protein